MFILDTLFIGGLRFVLDNLAAAAEAEMHDDSVLREQLLEAQMRLELGEIDEDQFRTIERDVLARIREIKSRQPGGVGISPSDRITGVEVETFDSNH